MERMSVGVINSGGIRFENTNEKKSEPRVKFRLIYYKSTINIMTDQHTNFAMSKNQTKDL